MSFYLASLSNCCCGFGGEPADEISLDEHVLLVKQDGTVLDPFSYVMYTNNSSLEEGETYTAKRFWFIKKSYRSLARYDTKEEAEKEFKRILEELSVNNTVVKL